MTIIVRNVKRVFVYFLVLLTVLHKKAKTHDFKRKVHLICSEYWRVVLLVRRVRFS